VYRYEYIVEYSVYRYEYIVEYSVYRYERSCITGTTARARPDEFIHIFVNNSQQLTGFLEAMIASEQTPDAAVIYNTLLELYLQTWAKLDPESQPTVLNIMNLLFSRMTLFTEY